MQFLKDLRDFIGAVLSHWQVLVTGGIVSAALSGIQSYQEQSFSWSISKWVLLAFLVLSIFLAWRTQRRRAEAAEAKLGQRNAEFLITILQVTTFLNSKLPHAPAILLVVVEIVNRGHDSIARQWKGHYKYGDVERDLLIDALTSTPLTLKRGSFEQVVTASDAIYNKTQTALARGGMATGVIVLHATPSEWGLIDNQTASLTVQVEDYLGNTFVSSEFKAIRSGGFTPYPGAEFRETQHAKEAVSQRDPQAVDIDRSISLGNLLIFPYSDDKRTQVYMQLVPPLEDDRPDQTIVDGVVLTFVNNGPVPDADVSLKVFLPPIKGPEKMDDGVRLVQGGVDGATSANLLIAKLGIGEKKLCHFKFSEVVGKMPSVAAWTKKYGSTRAWSKVQGDFAVVVYRVSFGPKVVGPPGGPPFVRKATLKLK